MRSVLLTALSLIALASCLSTAVEAKNEFNYLSWGGASAPSSKEKENGTSKETESEQSFSFEGVTCSISPPLGFQLTENLNKAGRMFIFTDPNKDKNEQTTLSLSIVPTGSPRYDEFLSGVLDPYRKGLQDYKEKKNGIAKINGIKFENRIFSGKFANGTPTVGFVYLTATRGSYFVFVGAANGADGQKNLDSLLSSIKSFK